MAVEDWARRTASALIGDRIKDAKERVRFVDGVTVLADALLSDEAVEAAAEIIYRGDERDSLAENFNKSAWLDFARAALQAAVAAVTEGESRDQV